MMNVCPPFFLGAAGAAGTGEWNPDSLTATEVFWGDITTGFYQDAVASGAGTTPANINGDPIGTWQTGSTTGFGNLLQASGVLKGEYFGGYLRGDNAGSVQPQLCVNSIGWAYNAPFCIGCRVKIIDISAGDNALFYLGGNERNVEVRKGGNPDGFMVRGSRVNDQADAGSTIIFSTWQTILFESDGTNITMYLDGASHITTTWNDNTGNLTTLCLGEANSAQSFEVSKFFCADAGLTADDRTEIFNWLSVD